MYAGTQSLLLCDAAQQSTELAPLVHIESGADGIIVLAGNAANLFCCDSAKRGEMQRIRPPVRRILPAFDQTTFLKFVQQRNQLARQDAQATGKLLLAESG
jgi:hypothetical protein